MKILFSIIIGMCFMSSNVIFDFSTQSNSKSWVIVNDGVMGGLSSGSFGLTSNGHGLFKGSISLENYGGFSMVRHNFKRKSIKGFAKIILKIKGDGKRYQFRIKSNSSEYYSYVTYFITNGNWQEIEIALMDMYPTFRGRKLNKPNFSDNYIEEIAFLIGNKKEEDFQLFIDKIELKE